MIKYNPYNWKIRPRKSKKNKKNKTIEEENDDKK